LSHGINASPSKRVHIGAGHEAACYSCLRCRPFHSLLKCIVDGAGP
jgi:hypothetical protein